jgi:hypothetical protein
VNAEPNSSSGLEKPVIIAERWPGENVPAADPGEPTQTGRTGFRLPEAAGCVTWQQILPVKLLLSFPGKFPICSASSNRVIGGNLEST